ncbi:SorA family sulfite dehydrogenase catalytic subunit [Comamonas terrae]|uniref:Molybdopterin-dependent oxidoreductase n=1 Tax=Comamonas terrae TaxID=673548 RepID=A0ABW5UKF9_9BURK|nr:molybdopterin-dependent oxidoreductase [Comamonas terrae]
MKHPAHPPQPLQGSRRHWLQAAGAGAALLSPAVRALAANAAPTQVTLPFANGVRELAAFPQKRPLILQTSRPPQLETPFEVFNEGLITPNDAFFVRYHWSGIPTDIKAEEFRVSIGGLVERPLTLSLAELKALGEPVSLVAVHQCSGNSRGFFTPRVNGGQLGNGAMGNAKWTGVPLRRVLEKAGLKPGAVQVSFNGMDKPPIDGGPDFVKALDIDHAMDGEVMLAWAMNDQDLPMLNGYPLRLVVPGYYGTYWIKHVNEIQVLDKVFDGFWMASAYRIPANACACTPAGKGPAKTAPIGRFNTRSFITSHQDGARLQAGKEVVLRGIAFDGGQGIAEVSISSDGGRTWQAATLGEELSRYSFREWKASFKPPRKGEYELKVRAVNRAGQGQPMEALWNPAGYMRNVVETVRINAV